VTLSLQVATGIDILTVYAPKGAPAAPRARARPPPRAARAEQPACSALTVFDEISPGSGDDDSDASVRRDLFFTLLVGLTFVLVTPFAIVLVDRVGRRALLLAGGSGMCACLVGLAVCYSLLGATHGGAHDALGAVCIVFVLGFVACFSFSWGPVAWIVPSELVPSAIRAKTVAAGTILNWLSDYLVVSTWLSLSGGLGTSGGFIVYALINAVGVAFVWRYVPETRGLDLEAIADADERRADSRLARLLPR
jgi:MFS family permease